MNKNISRNLLIQRLIISLNNKINYQDYLLNSIQDQLSQTTFNIDTIK